MREESHLEEMRSAIRGDFERLAERRGAQDLPRSDEDGDSEPAADERVDEEPRRVRSWLSRVLSP